MLELYGQIEEAVAAIKAKWDKTPQAGIILGTGLGGLVEEIQEEASLDYQEIIRFHLEREADLTIGFKQMPHEPHFGYGRMDETGRVFSKPWENQAEILPHLDVLVLSQEDIDYDLRRLEAAFQQVPLVVMTEYRDGSTVFMRQPDGSISQHQVPPRPATEVDPTGAGDIFATAFILRHQEIGDPLQAARFANVTASFGVEAQGVSGIPTRQQVLRYMEEHPYLP